MINVSTYLSLDGVMEEPQHWSLQFFDETARKYATEQLFASDALLLGRKTYEGFAASWPTRSNEDPFTHRINTMPKHVVTSGDGLEWENSHAISPDEVAKLEGTLLIYGSGQLTRTLLQQGLIDELRLWIHPVVVGSGLRLFPDGADPLKLRLVGSETLDSGVAILTYGR